MASAAEILAKKQKLGIDEIGLERLADPVFANGVDAKFGIARKRVIALKLLLFNFDPIINPPNDVEKKIVQDFFLDIRADIEFSKAVKQIALLGLVGTGRSVALLARLITYIYRTRHIDKFNSAFAKLRLNYSILNNHAELPAERKMSLQEYGNVYDVALVQPILIEYSKAGLLEELVACPQFTDFYGKVMQTVECLALIKSTVNLASCGQHSTQASSNY